MLRILAGGAGRLGGLVGARGYAGAAGADGASRGRRKSLRKQKVAAKAALKAKAAAGFPMGPQVGEGTIDSFVLAPPHPEVRFKLRIAERKRAAREARIAQLMEDMPRMLEEHRKAEKERKAPSDFEHAIL